MNKIVRDHYPVDRLPSDLREGLSDRSTVRVVIEVEDISKNDADDRLGGFADLQQTPARPMTAADTVNLIAEYRRENSERVTVEEAVARIRRLRDEWDD